MDSPGAISESYPAIMNTKILTLIHKILKNNALYKIKKVSVCDKLTLPEYNNFIKPYFDGSSCPSEGVVEAGGTAVGSVGIAVGSTAF